MSLLNNLEGKILEEPVWDSSAVWSCDPANRRAGAEPPRGGAAECRGEQKCAWRPQVSPAVAAAPWASWSGSLSFSHFSVRPGRAGMRGDWSWAPRRGVGVGHGIWRVGRGGWEVGFEGEQAAMPMAQWCVGCILVSSSSHCSFIFPR